MSEKKQALLYKVDKEGKMMTYEFDNFRVFREGAKYFTEPKQLAGVRKPSRLEDLTAMVYFSNSDPFGYEPSRPHFSGGFGTEKIPTFEIGSGSSGFQAPFVNDLDIYNKKVGTSFAKLFVQPETAESFLVTKKKDEKTYREIPMPDYTRYPSVNGNGIDYVDKKTKEVRAWFTGLSPEELYILLTKKNDTPMV